MQIRVHPILSMYCTALESGRCGWTWSWTFEIDCRKQHYALYTRNDVGEIECTVVIRAITRNVNQTGLTTLSTIGRERLMRERWREVTLSDITLLADAVQHIHFCICACLWYLYVLRCKVLNYPPTCYWSVNDKWESMKRCVFWKQNIAYKYISRRSCMCPLHTVCTFNVCACMYVCMYVLLCTDW